MYKIYVVEPGDTLEKISFKSNTPISILEQINGPLNNISLGMQIVIPSNENEYLTYTVMPNDNLYSISKRYNVSLNSLVYLNGLKKDEYIYPGQKLMIPAQDLSIYMTEEGKTLEDVASMLNITVEDILKNNSSIFLEEGQPIMYKREF